MGSPHAGLWDLDPDVIHLNHGSFGAAPRPVLERQAEWRRQMEANPVRFFARDLPDLLDEARVVLAAFIGADPAGLVFVPNASAGINAVLRSVQFAPGDEILVTDHAYGAARNAVDFVADASGAQVVTAPVTMPIADAGAVVAAIAKCVTARTRLAVIDHVTSPTGLVFPIAGIVAALRDREVPVLVDGAHAPGMIDLDLARIGAAYYTGNCHKWICAPKGAAFLWVAEHERTGIDPVVVGWGRTRVRPGRSQYHADFDWAGTHDPSAYLSVPHAVEVMGTIYPGGWAELRRRNHQLVVAGRNLLLGVLGHDPAAPETMCGAMAVVPLRSSAPSYPDPLQQHLADSCGIEVPVTVGPGSADRWIRLSAQAYNAIEDYEALASALVEWTAKPREP